MASRRQFDLTLNNRGYMLVRQQSRAWTRTGRSDTALRRSPTDTTFGNLPDEIDAPRVWDDFSGGFGAAYRLPDQPNRIHWSENMDTRFPRMAIHAQALQLVGGASTNLNAEAFMDVPLPSFSQPPAGAGAVLVLGKGYVASYAPKSAATFDRLYEATGGGAAFGYRPALFGSFSYIPLQNEASGFYQRGHNATYTQSLMRARSFVNAGDRLARLHDFNKIDSVAAGADPVATGNWSATLSVGPGNLPANEAAVVADQVYVGLADGVYAGDVSASFPNVLPELRNSPHPDNARDLAVMNNRLIVPHVGGIWEFQPSSTTAVSREVGPQGVYANQSPVRGYPRAVRGFGNWLYTGLFTGSESYLLAGRDEGDSYRWTVLNRLPHPSKIHRIHFDGITAASGGTSVPQRLWIATEASYGAQTGATAPVYFMPVPRANDNPLADTSFTANYAGSARMDLGIDDWDAPVAHKLFKTVEVHADNLASGSRYADVYYSLDGGVPAYLGRANVSPVSRIPFTASDDHFIGGQSLALSLRSFCTTPQTSPVYRKVVARAAARGVPSDEITAVVHIADNVSDRDGVPIPRSGAVMLQELHALANGAPGSPGQSPVRLTDLAGATSWVVVIPPVDEQEVLSVGDESMEVAATVRMAVLDLTTSTSAILDTGVAT